MGLGGCGPISKALPPWRPMQAGEGCAEPLPQPPRLGLTPCLAAQPEHTPAAFPQVPLLKGYSHSKATSSSLIHT